MSECATRRQPVRRFTRSARATHRVFEQLKRYGIANVEIIERRALVHIPAMKEEPMITSEADKTMALTHEDLGKLDESRACHEARSATARRRFWRTYASAKQKYSALTCDRPCVIVRRGEA